MVPAFDFADRLRKARRLAGMTMKQLADALGVAEPTISAWETGRNTPGSKMRVTCMAVQMVTGVSATWLETGQAPHEGGPDGLSVVAGRGFEPLTSGLQARKFPFRAVA